MLSVRFAFPTQTIHLETSPDKQQPDFGYLKDTRTREKIIDDYLFKIRLRLVKGSGKSDDPFTN
jgi:hypothetical protein